jgi:hypothetical protein
LCQYSPNALLRLIQRTCRPEPNVVIMTKVHTLNLSFSLPFGVSSLYAPYNAYSETCAKHLSAKLSAKPLPSWFICGFVIAHHICAHLRALFSRPRQTRQPHRSRGTAQHSMGRPHDCDDVPHRDPPRTPGGAAEGHMWLQDRATKRLRDCMGTTARNSRPHNMWERHRNRGTPPVRSASTSEAPSTDHPP